MTEFLICAGVVGLMLAIKVGSWILAAVWIGFLAAKILVREGSEP